MASPLLPKKIRQRIAEQIKKAVQLAAKNFEFNAADEDSLTGELVGKLVDNVKGREGHWSWKVRPYRISSNLEDGGEAAVGADLVMQVEVFEDGEKSAQKMVPIQGKKIWKGVDRHLKDQCKTLSDFPGSGIVADYRPGAYTAVRAEVARKAGANRGLVSDTDVMDLGTMLGDEFLACRIGTRDGHINEEGTEVVFPSTQERIRINVPHVAVVEVSSDEARRTGAGGRRGGGSARSWTPVPFGKNRGKTLPQIVFADPDWFFWAYETKIFKDARLAAQAEEIFHRATNIRIPREGPEQRIAEYLVHYPTQKFGRLDLVPLSQPLHKGGSPAFRRDRIDLSVARGISSYDKKGGKMLVANVKLHLFGSEKFKMTKSRAEQFFANDANFHLDR